MFIKEEGDNFKRTTPERPRTQTEPTVEGRMDPTVVNKVYSKSTYSPTVRIIKTVRTMLSDDFSLFATDVLYPDRVAKHIVVTPHSIVLLLIKSIYIYLLLTSFTIIHLRTLFPTGRSKFQTPSY